MTFAWIHRCPHTGIIAWLSTELALKLEMLEPPRMNNEWCNNVVMYFYAPATIENGARGRL